MFLLDFVLLMLDRKWLRQKAYRPHLCAPSAGRVRKQCIRGVSVLLLQSLRLKLLHILFVCLFFFAKFCSGSARLDEAYVNSSLKVYPEFPNWIKSGLLTMLT